MAGKNITWFKEKKTYCLVTGASRGLGREIAKQFAANVGEDSILLLVARKTFLLEEIRDEILAASPRVKLSLATYDLGKPDAGNFKTIIEDSLSENGAVPGDFQQVVVVHNAATTSTPKKALDYSDPCEWEEYLTLNVASPVCLNSVFLQIFVSVEEKLVLNISSLAAVSPLPTLSMYCSGKAARDMYFSALAAEEPSLVTLSYAPGPLDTEMYHNIVSETTKSFPVAAKRFLDIISNDYLISCEKTTKVLLSYLQEGNFVSGSHVDYHDHKNEEPK